MRQFRNYTLIFFEVIILIIFIIISININKTEKVEEPYIKIAEVDNEKIKLLLFNSNYDTYTKEFELDTFYERKMGFYKKV